MKPVRANLDTIAAATPGSECVRTSAVLAVHDDNFKWMPDESVDLVLTDPPFNIAQDTNFHTYEGNTINSYRFDDEKGWDTYTQDSFIELLNDWAREFARVLRKGGSFAVFCADAYVSHLIDALTAAGLNPRRTLTWRKPNAVPVNRKTMMMSSCEYVIVGVKGSNATFNADLKLDDPASFAEVERVITADKAAAVVEKAVRDAVSAVLTTGNSRGADIEKAVKAAVEAASTEAATRVGAMYVTENGADTYLRACVPNHVSFNSKAGNRLHTTEKPTAILRYLIALMSNPEDVILDPFGGSGSTGEAAFDTGRQAVIVERDDEYYGKLSSRLMALSQQESLI